MKKKDKKIDKFVDKMINPDVDFMFIEDCLKEKRCMDLIYKKIFNEIYKYINNKKEIKLLFSKYQENNKIAKFEVENKNKKTSFQIKFNKDKVELYFDLKSPVIVSNIYGVNYYKKKDEVTNIKVDLVSIKKKIMELI